MYKDEIYRLEERIFALKEDFANLRNCLSSTNDMEERANIESEMMRILDIIKTLEKALEDKRDEKMLADQEAQM